MLRLRIAWHLLTARFRQSLVAAAGVAFGIGSYVALISFMSGLNGLLDGLILNRTPHIRLYNEIRPAEQQPIEKSTDYAAAHHFIHSIKPRESRKSIHNNAVITESLRKDPRVVDVAPKVTAQVFYQSGSIEMAGVVNGIDPLAEERLFAFSTYFTEGRVTDLAQTSSGIVIGKGIADKMLIGMGDMIQVTSPRGETFLLKVVGIFQVGLADVDNTFSYTQLSTAQQLLGEPASYITDLQLKLHDMATAPALAREFQAVFRVDALDIQTANSQFETGSTVRSIISYAVGVTLLIVAGFGIYNILNMMIYEKMDSIAILKATGFSGMDVQRIFLSISMIIGIIGGIAGLLLGFGLSVLIDNIPFDTPALPTIKTFPIFFHPVYYVIGTVFSLITTFIAGWFPARKAARIDPVVIIRGK